MTNDEMQQKALKVVILSQLLSEAMDDIKGTTLYKSKIRLYGNILSNLLLSICKQTDAIYEEDPTMLTNIFNNIDGLVQKLAQKDIQQIIMINQIEEHYSKNPEDWENVFTVELQELDGK
jgi:hypothetical protein